MDLKVTIRQAGQLVDSSSRTIKRRLSRSVTVLEVARDRVLSAKVKFDVAKHTSSEVNRPTRSVEQAVTGRTYVVTREKDELTVIDDQGKTPSAEELAIVKASMDSVGRANPLAEFFNRRTIAVGQTVKLPSKLAKSLFSADETVGEVTRFDMTLKGVSRKTGGACAQFDTVIDTKAKGPAQPITRRTGQLEIELETCRTVALDFSTPVTFTETRGPKRFPFIVTGKGTMTMAIRTRHGVRK